MECPLSFDRDRLRRYQIWSEIICITRQGISDIHPLRTMLYTAYPDVYVNSLLLSLRRIVVFYFISYLLAWIGVRIDTCE